VHEIDLLRMKARLMEKSGEPGTAREVYERVLAQREYQWARAGMAKIRMANGEFEQARQMFQGVIAENRYLHRRLRPAGAGLPEHGQARGSAARSSSAPPRCRRIPCRASAASGSSASSSATSAWPRRRSASASRSASIPS
jgi:hypothetical protein